jgi:7-cyano-7-deazaguanine synthase in queuosine biosynthesis
VPARVEWSAAGRTGTVALTHAPESKPNFRLDLAAFHHYLQGLHQPVAIDLIRVAAHVYIADTSVTRGSDADIWGVGWNRTFDFTLPLLEPDRWNDPKVKNSLVACLRFLTGDDYNFTFTKWARSESQGYLALFESPQDVIQAESVCLLSGGLDSLTAAVQLCETGSSPLLISHRSGIKLLSMRNELVKQLRGRVNCPLPHWSVEITRVSKEAVERTQRSRAFLYGCLGSAAALCLKIPNVYLSDNGIASFNLIYSKLTAGSEATRSTHPDFVASFNDFLHDLLTSPPELRNSLLFWTRAETLRYLQDRGLHDLIGLTSSCARTYLATNAEPHCGTCSQCVDRRFAVEELGLGDHDSKYAVDVFTNALKPGYDSVIPEEYVRSAADLDVMSADAFVRDYSLPSRYDQTHSIEDQMIETWALHRRHAQTVLNVLGAKLSAFRRELATGALPAGCLLRVIPSPRHGRTTAAAEAIAEVLRDALPKAFGEAPRSERDVQRAVYAILTGYQPRFQREHPTVRFLGKDFTPDFAPQLEELVIEVKYPTKTRPATRIREEMASDITAFQSTRKAALFVLYDHHRLMLDETDLKGDLEKFQDPIARIAVIR